MVDSCYYSVSDSYVNSIVRCKIYSSRILVFHNGEKVADYVKQHSFNKWKIDISHYANTLYKNPKALINSSAFSKLDYTLKELYSKYFYNNKRDFLKLFSIVERL